MKHPLAEGTFWMSLSLACSPAGMELAEPVVICPEPQQLELPTPVVAEANALFPRSLVVHPTDERLVPYLRESVAMYRRTLGLHIELHESGIPFSVAEEVQYKGAYVDALAHYDKACSFDECLPGQTWVAFSEVMLGEKSWAMQHTVDHELGHILSGWGRPARMPMHLDLGNLMAPGCRNKVCWPLTENDATLLCAGSPCEWVKL